MSRNSPKIKVGAFAVIVYMAYLACQQHVGMTSESAALLKTDVEFSQASERVGAPQAFYAYLTEDAMQLPHGGETVYGRDNIRQKMSEGIEVELTWQPQKAEVARSGELGWTWGIYLARWQDDGGIARESHGKYLNIWEKQKDGTWRVAVDMGNQSPAPAPQ